MFGLIGDAIQGGMQLKVAREQMEFQERMSSTAFQRQMKDMRKAGLNPILARNMGGATTPPGAMPAIPDYGKAIRETKLQKAQRKKITAEAEITEAQVPRAQMIETMLKQLQEDVFPELMDAWKWGKGKFDEWRGPKDNTPKGKPEVKNKGGKPADDWRPVPNTGIMEKHGPPFAPTN